MDVSLLISSVIAVGLDAHAHCFTGIVLCYVCYLWNVSTILQFMGRLYHPPKLLPHLPPLVPSPAPHAPHAPTLQPHPNQPLCLKILGQQKRGRHCAGVPEKRIRRAPAEYLRPPATTSHSRSEEFSVFGPSSTPTSRRPFGKRIAYAKGCAEPEVEGIFNNKAEVSYRNRFEKRRHFWRGWKQEGLQGPQCLHLRLRLPLPPHPPTPPSPARPTVINRRPKTYVDEVKPLRRGD
ncbi:hypothetical protein B0T20DRAFT_488084 [Sordaria brevicollis]|uniref:Uncharacterized protein n=1 Tax=Sordaria brevicollis TaxID=83679 RepID=A0AAE0P2T7_SORBR|nr:hypothetical protein B0T20DRAFT_488084 [Sordaria brevicollis]